MGPTTIKSLCLRDSEQVSLTVSHRSEEGIRVANALQVLWRRLKEVRLAAEKPQRFLKEKHSKTFTAMGSCGCVNLREVGPQGADGDSRSTTDGQRHGSGGAYSSGVLVEVHSAGRGPWRGCRWSRQGPGTCLRASAGGAHWVPRLKQANGERGFGELHGGLLEVGRPDVPL